MVEAGKHAADNADKNKARLSHICSVNTTDIVTREIDYFFSYHFSCHYLSVNDFILISELFRT